MSSEGVPDYVIDPNVYVCDPLPQQSADENRVYPFYDHLRENRLTTTECQDCGQPARGDCPRRELDNRQVGLGGGRLDAAQ